MTDGAHGKIEAHVDFGPLFCFLHLGLQIDFRGLNLQTPAGVALTRMPSPLVTRVNSINQ
jgi:hypothetical protein